MSSTKKNNNKDCANLSAALSSRLWPDGIPSSEHETWLAMTSGEREIALRRANAIDSVLSSSVAVSDAARNAGVSSARFYALLREWKRTRSLTAITPHTSSRGRNRIKTPPEAESLARDLVRDHPSLTQEALALAVVERLPGVVSISKARRMIAKEKVQRNRSRLGGAEGFGQQLLVDRSALELEVRREDGVLDYAVFAAVADIATGYIIGHAVGTTEAGGAGLQHEAIAAAITELSSNAKRDDPNQTVQPQRLMVSLDSEDVIQRLAEYKRIHQLGEKFVPESEGGTRPVGLRLNRLLSNRLGNLKLRPASTFASTKKRLPVEREDEIRGLSLRDLKKIVGGETAEHNKQIMQDGLPQLNCDSIIKSLDSLSEIWS